MMKTQLISASECVIVIVPTHSLITTIYLSNKSETIVYCTTIYIGFPEPCLVVHQSFTKNAQFRMHLHNLISTR